MSQCTSPCNVTTASSLAMEQVTATNAQHVYTVLANSHKQCPTKCTGDNCSHCRCANCGDNHLSISPNCPKRPKRNSRNSGSKEPTRGVSSSTQRKLRSSGASQTENHYQEMQTHQHRHIDHYMCSTRTSGLQSGQ
jgi:hypothetical protein